MDARHVRPQDKNRIALARSRSKRAFDLRDLNLIGARIAYDEIIRYIPAKYGFVYQTFATKVLPLMERMGHAMIIKRVVSGVVENTVEHLNPKNNVWIVQADVLAVWVLFIMARYRRVESGEWKITKPWTVDDFIKLAYNASEEELAGILEVPDDGKDQPRLNKLTRRSQDGRSHHKKRDDKGKFASKGDTEDEHLRED